MTRASQYFSSFSIIVIIYYELAGDACSQNKARKEVVSTKKTA
jgi:hypothetical protein